MWNWFEKSSWDSTYRSLIWERNKPKKTENRGSIWWNILKGKIFIYKQIIIHFHIFSFGMKNWFFHYEKFRFSFIYSSRNKFLFSHPFSMALQISKYIFLLHFHLEMRKIIWEKRERKLNLYWYDLNNWRCWNIHIILFIQAHSVFILFWVLRPDMKCFSFFPRFFSSIFSGLMFGPH